MGTIWAIGERIPSDYCTAGYDGTVIEDPTVCPACTAPYRRVSPLRIDWNVGGKEIGDFTATGGGWAVTEPARMVIESLTRHATFGEVVHLNSPFRRRKSPPPLPVLFELVPTQSTTYDTELSTCKVDRVCEACGEVQYELYGFEIREHRWDKKKLDMIPYRRKRKPGEGAIFSSEVEDSGLFLVGELGDLIVCTTWLKDGLDAADLTNISFTEYGETA